MNYQNEKSLYLISHNELCEIIAYAEQHGLIWIFFFFFFFWFLFYLQTLVLVYEGVVFYFD